MARRPLPTIPCRAIVPGARYCTPTLLQSVRIHWPNDEAAGILTRIDSEMRNSRCQAPVMIKGRPKGPV